MTLPDTTLSTFSWSELANCISRRKSAAYAGQSKVEKVVLMLRVNSENPIGNGLELKTQHTAIKQGGAGVVVPAEEDVVD
jgi:hypothetical protein